MEIIKFDRVVSVSNELQGHAVQNILEGEISPSKNWMCEKGTERAVAILQLERPALVTSVHVGNAHSAFVEVLVGRAADGSDQFESLIPMSVFMNPNESKTGTNPNRTRFFNKSDFNEAAAAKTWDRVKVVCSQPFNKHVPYGLCFLKVHGEREARKVEVPMKPDDGDDIQIGSFFKKKRSSGGDKPLTVGEQMKAAEKEMKLAKPVTVKKKPEDEKREKKAEEPKKGTPTTQRKKKEDGRKAEEKKKEKEDKTAKRKADEPERTTKRRKATEEGRKRKKAFEKLLEDVVLVISGFKNPLRGDIRTMALEMGAKYSPDWEPHCTHLVCAYENTPKFQQVRGKGKIVTKDWVERCHRDRRRYPWRRFALDKTDLKKPESEEEIDAGEETDEEVPSTSRSPVSSSKKGSDDYNAATDDEEVQNVDTTDYPMPHLPDVFSQQKFYVDPSLRDRATLERYIVAYNGVLREAFDEEVDFYITERAPVGVFRKMAPNLVAIKPSWIWEINSKQKRISTGPHLIK